jgi:hypothetical protein
MSEIRARQVNGARIRIEAFRNQVHDVPECFIEVVGSRDDLGDVRQ